MKQQGARRIVKNKENVKKGSTENILPYKQNVKKLGTKKRQNDVKVHFLQQIKQGSCYTCTIYHRSLYKHSVRLFKHENYHILSSKLYHPVKSFDEKL